MNVILSEAKHLAVVLFLICHPERSAAEIPPAMHNASRRGVEWTPVAKRSARVIKALCAEGIGGGATDKNLERSLCAAQCLPPGSSPAAGARKGSIADHSARTRLSLCQPHVSAVSLESRSGRTPVAHPDEREERPPAVAGGAEFAGPKGRLARTLLVARENAAKNFVRKSPMELR